MFQLSHQCDSYDTSKGKKVEQTNKSEGELYQNVRGKCTMQARADYILPQHVICKRILCNTNLFSDVQKIDWNVQRDQLSAVDYGKKFINNKI